MIWALGFFLLLSHALALATLIQFDPWWFVAAVGWWQITGTIGISVGYHRQLAHGAFRAPKSVLFFHLVMGALAGQTGPLSWVRVHRTHHRWADGEHDPHSPRDGFWHGHWGWLFQRERRLAHRAFDASIEDLKCDPMIQWFETAFFPLLFLQLALLWSIGGWKWVAWLGFVRLVLVWNSAWIINSAGHLWGYRNYSTHDDSRNNRWLALITGGEGYHNNHHRFPSSARIGVRPREFDIGWWYVCGLKFFGLISHVRQVEENEKTGFLDTSSFPHSSF